MTRPRALLVTPVLPAATGNGLAMRAGLTLEALARIARVTVVVIDDRLPVGVVDAAARRHVGGSAVEHLVVHRPGGPPQGAAGVAAWMHDASSRDRLGRLAPLGPATVRSSPAAVAALVAEVRAVAGPDPFEIVHVLRLRSALWGEPFLARASVRMLDLDDDEVAVTRALAPAWHRRGRPDLAEQVGFEAAALGRLADEVAPWFDVVAVASPADAVPVVRHGCAEVVVVPNAVGVPAPDGRAPRSGGPVGPVRLVLVGDFAYLPNLWAAQRLVGEVLPAVRAITAHAVEVHLVGSAPPAVDALGREPGVHVHGRVVEPARLLGAASAAVLPIEVGSGTRIKVLEAFANEVPVVSTALGVEGLGVVDGTHCLVADDDAALARAVVDTVEHPAAAAARVGAARRLVLDRFEIGRVTGALAATWADALDRSR